MLKLKKSDTLSPLQSVLDALDAVILGKPEQVRLSLACVLAGGHLLVEDVPGVGKTTLVKSLARVLGLENKRVQFTNDLLPADILGTAIFDNSTQVFKYHPGAIFTHVLIADELNRGTPRTQSAFLQAMEERLISIDGFTRELPNPFFVVATQNPREQIGTYPLPESQLDRFLMRIHLGFPSPAYELELLKGNGKRHEQVDAAFDENEVLKIQQLCAAVHCSDRIVEYVQRVLLESRKVRPEFSGLSSRAGLALLAVARAWAYLAGRDFVLPEDIQATGPWVINHRMKFPNGSAFEKSKEFLIAIPVD